ncbi:RNA-dependent RNA polymerase [Colletotrichum karsti]|uniref:RNA-dependent RNA polymerase n=1 Tax=Colletotrichum karsti TaxID=1095194 RepID=A0A9P6I0X3_9PEZI|nr:RNA-dependent RNA polymerase [Colletotrichum karsti]KAF9874428.1 RNA-dependent RNA polymerase [Colletotrichum karsti]
MEVFLSNVPQQLTDRTLEKQLRPHMNALGLTAWTCSTRSNKNVGWITFLYERDGAAFLRRHGKQPLPGSTNTHPHQPQDSRHFPTRNKKGPKEKANLHLMGVPVFVARANKAPDPFMIKSIRHRLEEQVKQAPIVDEAIVFPARHLACGHNSFRNEAQALTFVEQFRLDVGAEAKFGRFMLILRFTNDVKVEIPYSSIIEMIHSSSPCTFTLVLAEPPRFYHLSGQDLDDQLSRLSLSAPAPPPYKQYVRCPGIPGDKSVAGYAGKCLVYQLSVIDADFDRKMIALENRRLFEITHFQIAYDPRPALWSLDYQICWDRFYKHLTQLGTDRVLPFRILFLLQSLVWNNFLHPKVAHDLVVKIEVLFKDAKAHRRPDPISDQAIQILRDGPTESLPFAVTDTDPRMLDPAEILSFLLETEQRIQTEGDYRSTLFGLDAFNHHTWVFKAVVTPTRVTLHGPEMEPLNRILRKHPNHADYFMRVQFCDEDGTDLWFNPRVSYEKVFERYRAVLNGGIAVAGRVYQFLGFSHSSLRSHATWFSAPFVDDSGKMQLYQNIIKSLGDFEHIQIPAKCAARIGQAFSETPSFISLTDSGIGSWDIPDIKSFDGDMERVFSDGVGTISQEALELIWPRLPRGSLIPTCLQIRCGGVKGMLSLDSRLPGRVMCIRAESMEKFPSQDKTTLEICDAASKPLKLVLNRQMIKIMEDLGVRSSFFLRLQKTELDRLRAVTADAYNTGTFLHMQGIGLNCFLPTFVKSLDRYGIDYRRDNFLRTMVESIVLQELRLLKHKARIPVPKGVTLFGIMDETGFLREGEVYIAYDTYRRPGRVMIDNSLKDGPVLVTRSPALHPGDIQLVKMRTPPPGHPLRNLRNCIAFSQHGKRDLPSQLSGGDLDGDLYNIIWDREAIPRITYNAADYPRVTPQALGRTVQREDMANWFVDFMKSDCLGLIATRHLVVSDQDEKGTVGQDCLTLAGLHSTAVDFSKTGIPVNPRDIPKAPRFRPDFLAPAPPAHLYDRNVIDFVGKDDTTAEDDEDMLPPHQYYKSEKVLGTLYRNVDEKQIWDEDINRVVSRSGPSMWEQFVGLMQRKIYDYSYGRISWQTRRADATRLRDVYEDTVANARTHFADNYMKPLTEVEVFCGSIFNKTGAQTRRQKDNSKKLKAEFDRLSEWLVAQMRRKVRNPEQESGSAVFGAASQISAHGDDPIARILAPNKEALEMSYACLMVGLTRSEDVDEKPLQSFKVIAASVVLKELTELANRVRGGRMVAPTNEYHGSGGGFVGVSSGPGVSYAYNGFDVDVGQYPNYGYSEYL